MSEVLTIEGIQYVTATHAGNHFGYTKDYISMLINAGKIEGHKIGRKWYVNLTSAEIFFKTANEQRIAYRKHISTERKKELQHHTQVRTAHRPQNAILETLVILILGLSIGVTGYLGTTSQNATLAQSDFSFFKNLAVSLYTFISPPDVMVVTSQNTVSLKHTPTSQNAVANALSSDSVGSTTPSSLVVAPVSLFATSSVSAVAETFSDEVTVVHDPNNPNTGIVIPIFKNTKGEPYRFLMVPVNAHGTPDEVKK